MCLIYCECGCGRILENKDNRGRNRKYIHGHNKNNGNFNTDIDFWRKVDIKGNDECWNWKGGLFRTGYGAFHINYKTVLAHRYSYEINHNKIQDNLLVLHKCDNKKCCNPHHLFIGTQKDNMHDMINKGRYKHGNHIALAGENNGNSKLNFGDVKQIRRLYKLGHTQQKISSKFNVSRAQISNIVNNKQWSKENLEKTN